MSTQTQSELLGVLKRLAYEAGDPAEYMRQVARLAAKAQHAYLAPAHDSRIDGKRIRAARKELGLTQEDAAYELGTSTATISNWERGVTPCDADLIIAALRGDRDVKLPRRFTRAKRRENNGAG